MSDLQSQMKDLQKTIILLHTEKENLLEHLKQQECNTHSTIMEYFECFEKLLERKDNLLKELDAENAVLKSSDQQD